MDISIIIPVYNEEESLRELSIWISKVMKEEHFSYEVIMVDDGSSDNSWKIINEISQKNSNIKGIAFRRNYGKSAALQTGFQVASGNVVITMDADLQDSPDEIPEFYKMIMYDGYDMVSGWKKKRHDPIHKRWPSKLYNRTVRTMSGIKLHDFNCGLKAYRLDVVKSIEVYGEMHRYIPVIVKWAGFKKIGEKVVKHYPRKFGKSKFGMERYAKGYLDLLTISFTSRYGKRPMHLFGLLGSITFLIGFCIALYLAYEKIVNQIYMMTTRPLFYFGLLAMILGTILFVGGFLGELICRNSPDRNKYLFRNVSLLKDEHTNISSKEKNTQKSNKRNSSQQQQKSNPVKEKDLINSNPSKNQTPKKITTNNTSGINNTAQIVETKEKNSSIQAPLSSSKTTKKANTQQHRKKQNKEDSIEKGNA